MYIYVCVCVEGGSGRDVQGRVYAFYFVSHLYLEARAASRVPATCDAIRDAFLTSAHSHEWAIQGEPNTLNA